MPKRLTAVIAMHDDHPPSRHYAGAPGELGLGSEERRRLPWPRVALIAERDDGVYLERLLTDGTVVGDTAHDDVAEAKEQAEWEYGALLGPWREVPDALPESEIPSFAIGSTER